MHRRTFIRLSATTTVAVTAGLSGCAPEADIKTILQTPQTVGAFCSHDDLIAIGKSYREANVDEDDPFLLKRLLLTDEHGGEFITTDPSALEEFLLKKITSDFATSDLSIIKGWILSRTEARQIALYSLS